MEEDIAKTPRSQIKPIEKRLQERLEEAVAVAQERLDYEAAHNPELTRALSIVEQFLKKKQRVCYGGTAMNMILPPKRRFYNPELDLPDYDFFTPELEEDIHALVADLKNAGFKDVYHKVGIHEGTKKILVNFVPIADCTHISKEVYDVFAKRAIVKGGIRYTDPDVLRMMMYLELSRPKGQVERWEKVYERLRLINQLFPPKVSSIRVGTRKAKKSPAKDLQKEVREMLLNYCIENQRILFTGPLDTFYNSVITDGRGGHATQKFPLQRITGPIGFLSPNIREDAGALQKALGGSPVARSFVHQARGEIVPEYIELKYHDQTVAILLQEVACHSFLNFDTPDGRALAVASLDTLITLYYAIAIFTTRAQTKIPGIQAKIPKFIQLVEKNRAMKEPAIPPFSLQCRGYQKRYSTLLREKVLRIQKEKE